MYKFNNGAGAVICNKCRVIIDEGISYDDYKQYYGATEYDLCDICLEKESRFGKKHKFDDE